MSAKIEKNENSTVTVNIEISPEDFNKAIDEAYRKNKGKFNVDGFRRGKAPKQIIENIYGKNIFYEDALDIAFPDAYTKAIEELDLKPMSRPVMTGLEKVSSEEGVNMSVEFAVMPEFEAKGYKGVEISPLEYNVTDEDVAKELSLIQDQNSRLVVSNEAAKDGDTAVIDFEGFLGDKAFEGGKGENYSLTLGSKTFIPGFEDQLIGKKAGDDVDVKVTFPKEYQASDLAGKETLFKVKIHEVKTKELSPLDDEFAKDVSEFDTLDEFKEELKKRVKQREEGKLKNEAVQKILDNAVKETVVDIPNAMVEEKAEDIKAQFEKEISSNGMDPKTYYEILKSKDDTKDENKIDDMFKEQAKEDLKQELLLDKIIETEKIEANEEEFEEEYKAFAKAYNQTVEAFKETVDEYTKDYIGRFIKQKKLFDVLTGYAKVKK